MAATGARAICTMEFITVQGGAAVAARLFRAEWVGTLQRAMGATPPRLPQGERLTLAAAVGVVAVPEPVNLHLERAAAESSSSFTSMSLGRFILILGASMSPAIQPGTRHVELFLPYADLKKGMIVDWNCPFPRERICHRIVAGWPGKWVTKGYANSCVDRGYCTPENYIGEIVL